MKGKAADRLRLAGIALGVAALLVLGPLAVGAIGSDEDVTDVAVINLDNYPEFSDDGLLAELDKADVAHADTLIIVEPAPPANGRRFACDSPKLPRSCAFLQKLADHSIGFAHGSDPVPALTWLNEPDEVRAFGNRVSTVRHGGGTEFGWKPAVWVALITTVLVAGSLYLASRSLRSRRPAAGVTPVYAHQPAPYGVPPVVPQRSVTRPGPAQAPAQSPPPARRRPPQVAPSPPPGPLPGDVTGAVGAGRRVLARTHFRAHGGFVDLGGVLLWASLERPGEHAYPGQPLSVLTLSAGSDSLVVSTRITEEVRQ